MENDNFLAFFFSIRFCVASIINLKFFKKRTHNRDRATNKRFGYGTINERSACRNTYENHPRAVVPLVFVDHEELTVSQKMRRQKRKKKQTLDERSSYICSLKRTYIPNQICKF